METKINWTYKYINSQATHNTTVIIVTTNIRIQIIITTPNCSNLIRIEMDTNGDLSPPIELPPMLNKIMLELVVRITVLDLPVGLKKCIDITCTPGRLRTATNIVIVVLQVQIPLILDDHVIKNYTSSRDVSKGSFILEASRTSNNGKPSLQHTKCPLNILSASFLCFRKKIVLLDFGVTNGLHKC